MTRGGAYGTEKRRLTIRAKARRSSAESRLAAFFSELVFDDL